MTVEIIQPIVKGISAAVVIPKCSSSFRIKRSSPTGARRALSTVLGNNNAQVNLRLAQSLLTISQEGFLKKWNFDPVNEVPLVPGRYQWTPVVSSDTRTMSTTGGVAEDITDLTLAKDITARPSLASLTPSATTRVPDLHTLAQDNPVIDCTVPNSITKQGSETSDVTADSEVSKEVPSPSSDTFILSTRIVSSKSQMCITDFLRPHKHRSSYHYDDCKTNTPHTKKLRTLL